MIFFVTTKKNDITQFGKYLIWSILVFETMMMKMIYQDYSGKSNATYIYRRKKKDWPVNI